MIRKAWLALVLVLAVGAPVFPFSGVAQAQDATIVDKLVDMNKRALEDYGNADYDSAKETLLAAINAGKRAGLDKHPVMARTYVHLGAVYLVGMRDRKKALASFGKALEVDPSIKLSKAMSTPELEDALAEAARSAGVATGESSPPPSSPPPATTPLGKRKGPTMVDESSPPPPPPPKKKGPVMDTGAAPARTRVNTDEDSNEEPDVPVRVVALDCPTPDEVPPDKAVRLRCAVAANLSVSSVVLLYRQPGSEEYGEAEMTKTAKGWYEGKIPKKVVTGKSVQFYFEGRNAAGKALVSNGRSDSPNLILIREGKAAEEAEAEQAEAAPDRANDAEENPLEERDSQGPRLFLGRVDKSRIGLDTRYGNRKWWIGLAAGSGFGYAKGNGLETRHDLQMDPGFKPGSGWAGLGQLAPEIGYQVTPDFAVSIEGRNQYIPQVAQFKKFTATGAQSVLLRMLFFTKQSRTRFFGSMMVGAGEGFRFVLYPDTDKTRKDYKDTVRGGPYLAGLGGGLTYEATHGLSLVAELNGLAGFPLFGVVVDLNLGIQINIY
jgi:hypothetical protein